MNRVTLNNGRIVLHDDPVYKREWVEAGGAIMPVASGVSGEIAVNGHKFNLATTRSGAPSYEFDSRFIIHGLKLFEVWPGGQLRSTYYPPDGRLPMAYQVGKGYEQRVEPKKYSSGGAGYYLYLTTNIAHFMHAFQRELIIDPGEGQQYAVGLCAAAGPFIAYDVRGRIMPNTEIKRAKKVAASWLCVDEIVHTFWN